IVLLGWLITDRFVEPRLAGQKIDGAPEDLPTMGESGERERAALRWAGWSMLIGIAVLAVTAWPEGSAWRGPGGSLTEPGAPLMAAIVPLIFVLFLLPGVVYGIRAGTVASSRDVIEGMTQSMKTM